MKVQPSGVAGVEIYGNSAPEFDQAVAELAEPAAVAATLKPALPWCVVLKNATERCVAFLGVRFDMVNASGKPCAVIHYYDTLRSPRKSGIAPGAWRLMCVENAYASLVHAPGFALPGRARMNLDNLRKMLQVRGSVDCVAFEEGEFAGPDTRGAFGRLTEERQIETGFIARVLDPGRTEAIEPLLRSAAAGEEQAARSVARPLLTALQDGGEDAVLACARAFRHRIPIWKQDGTPQLN